MQQAYRDTITELAKKNMRIALGRISQTELRTNHFVSALFDTFAITSKKNSKTSLVMNRARIQELIAENTMPYTGKSRYPILCENEFIQALDNEFSLSIKKPDTTKKTHNMKRAVTAIFILMLFACDSPPTQQDQKYSLTDDIAKWKAENVKIEESLPIQEEAADTIMAIMLRTKHTYTRNILSKDLQDLQAIIEKNKETFENNLYQIGANRRQLTRMGDEKEQRVPLIDDPDTLRGDSSSRIMSVQLTLPSSSDTAK